MLSIIKTLERKILVLYDPEQVLILQVINALCWERVWLRETKSRNDGMIFNTGARELIHHREQLD